jgi:hypothetical protein
MERMPPPLVIAVSVCADQRRAVGRGMGRRQRASIAVSRQRTVVLRRWRRVVGNGIC